MAPSNLLRKAASIDFLKGRGVRTIDHLPPIEPDEEVEVHSASEVFRRMRAQCVYFMRGQFAMERESVPLAEFRKAFDRLHAWDDLSPNERKVVDAQSPSRQQIVETSWALEAIYALQWALQLADDLPWPDQMCNMDTAIDVIKKTGSSDGLQVRPTGELLDQLDLHYRLLWVCRDDMLKGKEPPANLNASVVIERVRALDWLVHRGISWDDANLSS